MKDVIYISVGFLLTALIAPIGLLAIADANTTGWNASVITIFQTLLPIIYVIGVAIYFIKE